MTKIAGSGSISQRHGFADPDPHQNAMDPEHCSSRYYAAIIVKWEGISFQKNSREVPGLYVRVLAIFMQCYVRSFGADSVPDPQIRPTRTDPNHSLLSVAFKIPQINFLTIFSIDKNFE
jgi:hypothetical protein